MVELFENICSDITLFDAWRRVQRKGASGGIDRVTIAEFGHRLNDNLASLRADLLTEQYVPEPFQKIAIPKLDSPGESRPLQLPTVRDKIAQEAVRSVIDPILEKTFADCSYAYRQGKGPQKAIRRVEHYLSAKKHWIASADIDRFFDTMDQDLVLEEVKQHVDEPEILRLLALWMKMGAMDKSGRWVDPLAGVAQGSVISPLLSNVYLTPFDRYMTEKGHALVRYADDYLLLASSMDAARQALEDGRAFLKQRLKLNLNVHPRPIGSLEAGFVFLGIYFRRKQRRIAKAKITQMKAEIRSFWQRYGRARVSTVIQEVNESILGWKRYYGTVQPAEQFSQLDNRRESKNATPGKRARASGPGHAENRRERQAGLTRAAGRAGRPAPEAEVPQASRAGLGARHFGAWHICWQNLTADYCQETTPGGDGNTVQAAPPSDGRHTRYLFIV